jgi:hypothetical protein
VDTVHQLDAGDRDRRITEPLEAKHHSDTPFDAPVVLLNQVIIRHNFRDATGSMTLRAVGCILG